MPHRARRLLFATLASAGLGLSACAASESQPAGSSPLAACVAPASWAAPARVDAHRAPRPLAADALLADIAQRQVVLLGARHDSADDHRWQLQVLAALHARRPDMVIGFEMFPRRVQPVLDRWVAGELGSAQFLREVGWDGLWSFPAELYMPLFEFARLNRIPMIALNVDLSLIRSVASGGWDATAPPAREGVGRASAPPADYVDLLFASHREHARMRGQGEPAREDAAFRHFVESQTTWDRAMAEALATHARAAAGERAPLAVGIMGSGHVRFGHGVAHQLHTLGVSEIGTLLPLPASTDCAALEDGLADAVFALPARADAAPPPPRLGVMLETQERGVRIADVTADSLAARSGLETGDLIVDIGGRPAKSASQLVAAIRRQPPGTWLPLTLERAGVTREIVIRFPPDQP